MVSPEAKGKRSPRHRLDTLKPPTLQSAHTEPPIGIRAGLNSPGQALGHSPAGASPAGVGRRSPLLCRFPLSQQRDNPPAVTMDAEGAEGRGLHGIGIMFPPYYRGGGTAGSPAPGAAGIPPRPCRDDHTESECRRGIAWWPVPSQPTAAGHVVRMASRLIRSLGRFRTGRQ